MHWPETFHRDIGAVRWTWRSRLSVFYYAAATPPHGPSQAQGIWLERVSPQQMFIIDLFRALNMPSLSQLLNAHFQVIEIHQEVWLICEYRLASPLATEAKLPAWQPLVLKIHEISGRNRRGMENDPAGVEMGVV